MERVATSQRLSNTPIGHTLFQQPYQFPFTQLVSLVQQLLPNKKPVGSSDNRSEEAINFISHLHHGVPGNDVYAVRYIDKQPLEMEVNYFTIAGPQGPLPEPYSAIVYDAMRAKNYSLKDFLDIFNHRLVSISYRVLSRVEPLLKRQLPHHSMIGHILSSLCGFSNNHLLEQSTLSHEKLLPFAQLLWQRPTSTAGLETLLEAYFKCEVNILPFQGGWYKIPLKYQTITGVQGSGQNNRLGINAFLGNAVWEHADHIALHLGPLPLNLYLSFLPNGAAHKTLLELIRLYLGIDIKYKLYLKLEHQNIPRSYLKPQYKFTREKLQDAKLGWTSFLHPDYEGGTAAEVFLDIKE